LGLTLICRFAEEGFNVPGFDADIKKAKNITAEKD